MHKNVFIRIVLFLSIFNSFLLVMLLQLNRQEIKYPEIKELKEKDFSFKELSQFFTNLAEKKGAKYAFDVLKVAPVTPNTDMHLLGHVVGDGLYKQQGVEGITICTHDFRNACSHAIVIGAFTDEGEEGLSKISQVCKQSPGGKGAYAMCFHGLGHGILAAAGYDLPKAIEICKKTETKKRNEREAIECIGGTIMEIVGGGFHDREIWQEQRQKYLSKNNSLAPCNSSFMPDEARAQCYSYLSPYLFELAGASKAHPTEENFREAFLFCQLIPASQENNRRSCFGGFGKEFVVLAKNRDVRNIENMADEELSRVYAWCRLTLDREGVKDCIVHATNSLYWGGENDRKVSIRFCSLINDSLLQASCFSNLIRIVGYYIDDAIYKKSFCGELPDTYQKICGEKLITPS